VTRLKDTDVSAELIAPAQTVLEEPYPAMGGIRTSSAAPPRGCRVGNPDYFDRYFALGIPQDDISDAVVREALAGAAADEAGPGRDTFVRIVTGDDDDLALRALLKAGPFAAELPPQALPRVARFIAGLVLQLPDASTLTGNHRATAVSLIAALLQRSELGEPARIVAELQEAAGISAIAEATRLMLQDREIRPGNGLSVLLPLVAEHCRSALLANFAARDAASRSDLVMTMVEVVEQAGMLEALSAQVREGVDNGRWTLEDVASRFVAVHQMVGGSAGWEIDDFRHERFAKLLPPEPSSDPLPPADGNDHGTVIDQYDVSWSNRRRVARRALALYGWH
jgi:hypothetical protein